MKPLALLTVTAMIVTGCTADGENTATSRDQALAEIEAQGDRWIEAIGREDAEAAANLYAEDALFLPPGAETLRGRDTIRGLFRNMFDAMDAEYSFTVDRVEIEGNWAWRHGGYEVTAVTAAGDTLHADDKFVDIWWRGDDGTWRIVADIWNSNDPPPTAAATSSNQES